MITQAAIQQKIEQELQNPTLIETAMPVFADLRGTTVDQLEVDLTNSEIVADLFYKFCVATVVTLVCDKAAAAA